jgi:hypothetical protein
VGCVAAGGAFAGVIQRFESGVLQLRIFAFHS